MSPNSVSIAGCKVVVTGGTGLIGRAIVDHLVAINLDVTVLDQKAPAVANPDARYLVGDVLDEKLITELAEQNEFVVHMAGIPGLEHGTETEIYRANALGTFMVMNSAAKAGVRKIIYASSINANGIPLNPNRVMPTQFPWGEDEPPQIADHYSLSKQANEHAAEEIRARYSVEVTGLRYPLVRDLFVEEGQVFGRHIRKVLHDDARRAACEGFSYLDASDAAKVVQHALELDVPDAPGILVAARNTFLSTLTETALAKYARDVPRASISGREVALDLTRQRTLLEFEPQVLLEAINPELLIDIEKEFAND